MTMTMTTMRFMNYGHSQLAEDGAAAGTADSVWRRSTVGCGAFGFVSRFGPRGWFRGGSRPRYAQSVRIAQGIPESGSRAFDAAIGRGPGPLRPVARRAGIGQTLSPGHA